MLDNHFESSVANIGTIFFIDLLLKYTCIMYINYINVHRLYRCKHSNMYILTCGISGEVAEVTNRGKD